MGKRIAALVLLLLASGARAATVHLRDGTKLQGAVKSVGPEAVVLETASGTIRIRGDRVARIDYDEPSVPAAPSRTQALPPPAPLYPREYGLELSRFGAGSHALSLYVGVDIPASGIDFREVDGGSATNGGVGPMVSGQYLYQAGRRLGLGFEAGYLRRSTRVSGSLFPLADSEVSGESLALLGVARWLLREEGPARPYLLAGGGAQRTSTVVESTPFFGFAWADTTTTETRRLVDGRKWGPAATARVGVEFLGVSPSVFGLEAGWTWIDNADYPATGAGRDVGLSGASGPIHMATLTARWGFGFGGD